VSRRVGRRSARRDIGPIIAGPPLVYAPDVQDPTPVVSRDRLLALDVFRGVTMAGMVIVNNPGDWSHVYAPLLHAPWDGWTPTDLIFPFFLFIVGVSITLSKKTDGWSILRRTAILFAIGLFLNAFPRFDIAHLRWPGVLQRIALCYGAAAAFVYWRRASGRGDERLVRDIILAILVLLFGYWAVMVLIPGSTGMLGDLSMQGNVAARVDRTLLAGHIYRPYYDPEGLLSTLPAIGTTLFGVLTGLWLRQSRTTGAKANGLIAAGVIGIIVGLIWGLWFPINKALWTSSYTVFAAGGAALLLGLCLLVIDVAGWKAWTRPFVILGRNALALYVLSGLLTDIIHAIRVGPGEGTTLHGWIYQHGFVPFLSPINASLAFAIANLVVLFLALWAMDRRGIMWRV